MATRDVSDEQVVEGARLFHAENVEPGVMIETIETYLHRVTGQPVRVCERAISRAIRRGLLECGVSERTGWPTEKGLALLKGND